MAYNFLGGDRDQPLPAPTRPARLARNSVLQKRLQGWTAINPGR